MFDLFRGVCVHPLCTLNFSNHRQLKCRKSSIDSFKHQKHPSLMWFMFV